MRGRIERLTPTVIYTREDEVGGELEINLLLTSRRVLIGSTPFSYQDYYFRNRGDNGTLALEVQSSCSTASRDWMEGVYEK